MSILDLIKEDRSKKKYTRDMKQAIEIFDKQKAAIKWIESTKGFNEIREYFVNVVWVCNERFRTMKSEKDLNYVQWQLEVAMWFLDFIDNLLNDDTK